MKFHFRIIQFDILLVLNKYTLKNSPILVKSKTEFFSMANRIHYSILSIIILWQLRIYNFFNLSRL